MDSKQLSSMRRVAFRFTGKWKEHARAQPESDMGYTVARVRLLGGRDTSTLTGLRDRALIGIMIYTFARVGAVLQMKVGDYISQGRCGWVRLYDKGGKEHEAPCVPKLEVSRRIHCSCRNCGR